MPVLLRNVTRTIKNSTETTSDTQSPNDNALGFALTTSDSFYVGYKKPFACRYFHLKTVNSNAATVSVKYWDGSAYTAVEDLVDQTSGFTGSGWISWVNPGGWTADTQSPVSDLDLYWIKITVSSDLSAGTELQSVLNLFCDDELVKAYYPELISDSRYLPDGKSDFIEQYNAAKDLVILRLKQSRIIDDESQIIDPNEVAVSAVHAFAWILLNPIADSEGMRERADKAYELFNRELNQVKIDFDEDNSGVIEEGEKNLGNIFIARA